MNKRVFLYGYPPKLHSLYKTLITHPPDGYTFVYNKSQFSSTGKKFYTSRPVKLFALRGLNRVVNTVRIKDKLYKFKKFPSHDLIHSAGYLCLRKEPWVVDFECVNSFTGYDFGVFERRKKAIERVLAGPHCKALLPWSESAANQVRLAFPNNKEIHRKLVVAPIPVKPQPYKKRKNCSTLTFLFVGSMNLPFDFPLKGGYDVFEAFVQYAKKNPNAMLIVRSTVPSSLSKYRDHSQIEIVETFISRKELNSIYKKSDVFLFPAHNTAVNVIGEAMSWSLPVILTDTSDNPNISKGAGILVSRHKSIEYFGLYESPHWDARNDVAAQEIDTKRIASIVAAMTKMEDSALRMKLGRGAWKQTQDGCYSLKRKKKILKKVYDEALKS